MICSASHVDRGGAAFGEKWSCVSGDTFFQIDTSNISTAIAEVYV